MINRLLLEAENNQKIDLSVRLVEYLALYNSKKCEIQMLCPMKKTKQNDDQNEIQIQQQCFDELNDPEIQIKKERKRIFQVLREKEREEREQQERRAAEQKKRKSALNLVADFFGGKSKEKQKQKQKQMELEKQKERENQKQKLKESILALSSKLPRKNGPKQIQVEEVEDHRDKQEKVADSPIHKLNEDEKEKDQINAQTNIFVSEIDPDQLLSYHSTEKQKELENILEEQEEEEISYIKKKESRFSAEVISKEEEFPPVKMQSQVSMNTTKKEKGKSRSEIQEKSIRIEEFESYESTINEKEINIDKLLILQNYDLQQKLITNRIFSGWSSVLVGFEKSFDEKWKREIQDIPKPNVSTQKRLNFSKIV